MKKLFTVFNFELKSYIKSKSFMITTIFLSIILFGAMFLPKIVDMSSITGITNSKEKTESKKEDKKEDVSKYGYVDPNHVITDQSSFKLFFKDATFTAYDSEEALKKQVKDEKIDAGFVINSDASYTYYVVTKPLVDELNENFNVFLSTIKKQNYCSANNLSFETLQATYDAPAICNEKVLGKDAANSVWYCYALIIIIFMAIIFYGVMIATSVTNEKSNRSIEVLVTSINSSYLLFGKVLAGAVAAFIQLFLILGGSLLGYSLNRDAWGGKLDMVLNVPIEVIVLFAMFGIGGFLFYAFLYGALGALVSKTEDINKSTGNLQFIIMIVYFITMFQLLKNPTGILMTVLSYLPFSSYTAMFVRAAMGDVAIWEIALSFIILVISIIGTGFIAAKIYRLGTLRYGNPIKLKHALKDLKLSK